MFGFISPSRLSIAPRGADPLRVFTTPVTFTALAACLFSTAAAGASPNCANIQNFGSYTLQCSDQTGRDLCTIQYNGDPAQGFRLLTRSATGEAGGLTKTQTLLMFASPELHLTAGQNVAVEIAPAGSSPVQGLGTPINPSAIAIKIDSADPTFWIVGSPPTMTWTVTVGSVQLTFALPHDDFANALNTMSDCQTAYAQAHGL